MTSGGSYEGQVYLNQSIQYMAPEQYGFTIPLISGIVCCLFILYFGFRLLPS